MNDPRRPPTPLPCPAHAPRARGRGASRAEALALVALVLAAPVARASSAPPARPEPSPAAASEPSTAPDDAPAPVAPRPLLGGSYWRLESPNGPVHVWRPAGLRADLAGTVVYFHGYYTDVDEAWQAHRLAAQFRASGRNALFIAASSPTSNPDPVKWPDPAPLLAQVRELAGIDVPERNVVAVAHSGAFRTLVPWLASPLLDQVVLLDGLYGSSGAEFEKWLRASPAPGTRRLVLVGFETAERCERLASTIEGAITREGLPFTSGEFTLRERRTPLLYLRSQYGHMELVTDGLVIPTLLRIAGLEPL